MRDDFHNPAFAAAVEGAQPIDLAAIATAATPLIGEAWGIFNQRELPTWDTNFGLAGPGQVVLINAVTNGGKSTIIKAAGLCLAAGRSMPPLVNGIHPKKVMIMDFEGEPSQEREDIRRMMREFSDEEKELISENLIFASQPLFDADTPLKLNIPSHLERFAMSLDHHKPEVAFIDTRAAGFSLRSENDNSELLDVVMTPLKALARQFRLTMVLADHIGKAKSEDGVSREAAHRGRGASAKADQSSSIFNLDANHIEGTILLSCAKVKGRFPNDVLYKLDPDTRWPVKAEPIALGPSEYDRVMEAFYDDNVTFKALILVEMFAGHMSDRTVRRQLETALRTGDLFQPKHGFYKRPKSFTPITPAV